MVGARPSTGGPVRGILKLHQPEPTIGPGILGLATSRRMSAPTPSIAPAIAATPTEDPSDLDSLRRQQDAFRHYVHDQVAPQWSWMAAPALAPVAGALGLEAAGILGARALAPLAPVAAKAAPIAFKDLERIGWKGDFWATRKGRLAHRMFKDKVDAKAGQGWRSNPAVPSDGRVLRPDAGTPVRDPAAPDRRYYLELKPDTPTGRAAGIRALRKYGQASQNKTRIVYYDPKAIR